MAKWIVELDPSYYEPEHIKILRVRLATEEDNSPYSVTASGCMKIEVEAETAEEAETIAIITVLKNRVKDLIKLQRDQYDRYEKEISILKEQAKPLIDHELKFSQMIRQGELHIVNTGHRIIGTWYKDPEVSVTIPSNGKLGAIIRALEEAYPEEECY